VVAFCFGDVSFAKKIHYLSGNEQRLDVTSKFVAEVSFGLMQNRIPRKSLVMDWRLVYIDNESDDCANL